MWWALGAIGLLAAVSAVFGWRRPVGNDGGFESWIWFGSGDDSGWGLFDSFSSDSDDCGGGDCSSD